jgi:uncharacterized protein YqeY
MAVGEVDEVVAGMRAALRDAMRARDAAAVTALRTALGAIANAEAPPIGSAPLEVRGELVQHDRVALDLADVRRILAEQIADREDTIRQIAAHGRDAEVAVLQAEADVLRRQLAAL